MSTVEKNEDTYACKAFAALFDKEAMIRRKVALKHWLVDEKCHRDCDQCCNDLSQSSTASVAATAKTTEREAPADDLNKSLDEIVQKTNFRNFFSFQPKNFRVYCKCDECLQFREVLIQLVLEDREYNTLWDRLKALIREFYDVVPQNPVPSEDSMDAKYESLIGSQARWFTDGEIDRQKNIQLSLSSQLPLSNEMTFVLVFSMLYTRDPHQLFELLCIQLRCISIAYSEGLKKLIKTNEDDKNVTYNPVKLLTFILDGYDKFCSTAKKLSSLLFELQRDHLHQFLLTWSLLNKRMYQRYVYSNVQELIPECILKLKDQLDSNEYSTMAHRLIRFDENMTSITKTWTEVWSLLQEYHMTFFEPKRRISSIQNMLKALRDCEFDYSNYDKLLKRENSSKLQWMKMENRDEAWILTVDYLKRVWNEKDDSRLYAVIRNERCATCSSELACHHVDCDCVTCSFAGSPCANQGTEEAEKCCTKCSFYEKLDRDYLDYIKKDVTRRLKDSPEKILSSLTLAKDEDDDSDNDIEDVMLANHYHLSWAVFKHLSSRKVYCATKFDARHFCSFQDPPCTKNECRVATHIIAGLYPLNFSKFLIKAYQPLKEEERKELMNIQKLYFSYLMQKITDDKTQKIDMLHQMDLLWNIDDAEYTLFCDIGSAFAECYLIDMLIPVHDLLDSCFIVDNHDIELNMYWLECIYMFKESDNSPLKKIENDPKVLEFQLRMQMDQISSLNDAGKFSTTASRLLAEKSGKSDSKGEKCENEHSGKLSNKLKPESYERLKALLDVMKPETRSDKNDEDNIVKECKHDSSSSSSSSSSAKAKKSSTSSKAIESASPTVAAAIQCKETKCKKHDICDKDNLTEKDVTLADAVKIAVKQKLNQKLEAELKSLKKEHSVLKDMVRDLEQIKENEENQLITKKEKVTNSNSGGAHHCCSEHSDMLENHSNHPKMCHRGDGLCTCYYCTIFGHTECNHGRTNETRDRLRKRLHQIHSKSSTKTHNSKNNKSQPGVLKKMLATKVPTANSSTNNSTATISKATTKPVVEQKENSANELLEAALQENWTKLGNANSKLEPGKTAISTPTITATATNANITTDPKNVVKKRKLFNVVNQHYQHLYECESGMCKACDDHRTKTKTKTELPPLPNGISDAQLARVIYPDDSASLDDLLDFIEGNNTNKKDSQKKAAKKAKQKQKKEDVKRIEELEQLRDEFHDVFFREVDAKNDLKNLKSVKKRDKKKILEMEGSVKKYGKFKSKIESNILELIGVLKKNNSEFKFAYLPTKEQQLQKQQQQVQNSQATTAFAEQAKNSQEKNNGVKVVHQQAEQRQDSQQSCEISLDQSKRMVTIRRINLPHAEPQVTVTAKGASPDKDKLLYTFINGQLFPSANASTATATAQATPNDKSDKRQNHMSAVESGNGSNAKSNKKIADVSSTDKSTKKTNKNEKAGEKSKPNDKNNGRKQSPENDVQNNVDVNDKKSSAVSTAKSVKNIINTASKEKDKQKKKSKKELDDEIASITSATREITLAEEKPKKEKKKAKAIKFEYADPNYKVNQFDLLDMDGDDGYYIESSSDESTDSEPPKVINKPIPVSKAHTPPVPSQQVQQQQQLQQNKNSYNKNKPVKNPKAAEEAQSTKKPASIQNVNTAPVKSDKRQTVETNTSLPKNQSNANVSMSTSISAKSSVDSNLTKKQKKKLAQQQQTNSVRSKSSIEKSITKAENMANSLNNSMQRLHLNSDTTIELVDDNHSTAHKMTPNVSIMDQLNRGVRVEGLMLPPGITLTRVDPNTAEGLRAKKESINRITQSAPQQYQQPPEYQRPPPFLTSNGSMMPMQASNGFIMVDPMQNVAAAQQQLTAQTSKKSRKNRKKNKNKSETELTNENNHPGNQQGKIVTLRNPLFQATNDTARNQPSTPSHHRNQMPLNVNQSASIIKNDNGMYTIRNPALHQALSNGVGQGYRQYPGEVYPMPDSKVENYSYFSENATNVKKPTTAQEVLLKTNPKATPPSHMAIGSEIKNAQQIKNTPWYPINQQKYAATNGDIFNNIPPLNPQQSYSPFDMATNFGLGNDFFSSGSSNVPSQATTSSQSQYYNGSFAFNNPTSTDSESLFGNRSSSASAMNSRHCCDDLPPSQDQFYDKRIDDNSYFNKYEENPFLHGLHPGQRLNSEVTIHNIGDAKFNRESIPVNLRNGVEITRINGPDGYAANPNLAVGSHRQTTANAELSNRATPTEFGDNIFVPNSSVNLNELESEERDIETFKRFNYYFEPPKNKPKINFNMKDIVVTKKQPTSDNSSPYFGELAGGSSLSNTPHPEDDLYQELNAFKPNNCDPLKPHPTTNRIHLDNFLHGIIGDELQTDQE